MHGAKTIEWFRLNNGIFPGAFTAPEEQGWCHCNEDVVYEPRTSWFLSINTTNYDYSSYFDGNFMHSATLLAKSAQSFYRRELLALSVRSSRSWDLNSNKWWRATTWYRLIGFLLLHCQWYDEFFVSWHPFLFYDYLHITSFLGSRQPYSEIGVRQFGTASVQKGIWIVGRKRLFRGPQWRTLLFPILSSFGANARLLATAWNLRKNQQLQGPITVIRLENAYSYHLSFTVMAGDRRRAEAQFGIRRDMEQIQRFCIAPWNCQAPHVHWGVVCSGLPREGLRRSRL